MNEAISAAIAANLPAAVASELSTYLKQADADKTALANVRRDLEMTQRDLAAAKAKLCDQATLDERERALGASQMTLRSEQLALAMDRAKLVAEVATASRDATLDTVKLFLKLPSVRTDALSTAPVVLPGSPGNPQYGQSTTYPTVVSGTETSTTTKRKNSY